ncbi:4-hydroxythreonine-4-phosphate dehydrogenase PdxA [Hyphococcus sp.]|uniref:4-hydroxythreonine-4-phosphate dehydrogenase PdxA n=1 Tax=Hyphococcus sp. TaxID=2038636 RepID=UPI003CCBB283
MAAPLALTMGEPGGVGPEITVKAWAALRDAPLAFFALADPSLFAALDCEIEIISAPREATSAFRDAIPVLPLKSSVRATPGLADSQNAAAVIESIKTAVSYCLDGAAAGVVTNPIQKSSLIKSGFEFPGHTEYLADLTGDRAMPANRTRGPVMMIAAPQLKTVPVTIHQSVTDASASLNAALVEKTCTIVAEALTHDFGFKEPRLAVSGFNPHAGEDGALGKEDKDIIAPAIQALKNRGFHVAGPLPADTMFHQEARARYDAAICMLHDQALIPAKTLAFHDAVNVTLGLPIVRTSPDHGTALDIAGKGTARADSLIAAIRLGALMASKRTAL